MKLGLGIVTAGGYADRVPTEFMWSLYALHSHILRGLINDDVGPSDQIEDCQLIRSGKFPTDCARNEIVQKALEAGCDALLFLDADHEFDPSLLSNLLRCGKNIVTARYHVKGPPYHANLYLKPKTPHLEGDYKTVHYGRGLFPVDMCGAGALLIRRPVMEAIGFPWFRYGTDPRPPHDLSVSEDVFFCKRAQEEGFEIWADWETEARHITRGSVGGEWNREYLAEMEREIANGRDDLVSALVACGYPEGYQLPSGQIVPDYQAQVVA